MDKSKSKSDKFIYDEKTWNVLDEYFKSNRLTLHQINSYNDFIDTLIPKTLSEISPIKQYWNFDTELNRYRKEINITLSNPCMSKPIINENNGTQKPMLPLAARLRKLTYSGSLTCDVKSDVFTYEKDERKLSSTYEHKGVLLGKIPIMIGSNYCILKNISNSTKQELGECIYDLGGYFIVIGNEKVIIPQEILSANKIYIFKSNKNLGKTLREARVTSIPEKNSTIIKPVIVKLINADNRYGITFKVNVKRFKVDIPLFILFRALGVLTDKAIVKYIVGDINEDTNNIVSYLDSSIEESMYVKTKELAIDYLGKQSTFKFDYVKNQSLSDENKYTYIEDILLEDLFPHLGKNPIKKAYFLGYMIKKLILVHMGILPSDDRDSFLNKKVETIGQLLNSLFRINLNKVTKDIKSSIEKDIKSGRTEDLVENVYKKIKPGTIELGIKFGLATGNWGIQQKAVRQGIAIMLNRLSYASYLSFVRKINAPLEKTLKAVDPRFLHNTQYGTLCPSETPEGSGVGIIKNMAMLTNITINSSPDLLYDILEEYGVIYIENCIPEQIYNNIKVFINGDFVGITDGPHNLMIKLRIARRSGIINIFTSLSWDIGAYEIRCDTSAGRLCRPLYIVENNELLMNNDIADRIKKGELLWNDLICDKNYTHDVKKNTTCVIEYLDISEINTMMIAMTYNDIVNNNKDNKIFVNYTHCELHPSMMYGAVVSSSPFVNHNQAARNQFQGSMGTQAIGLFSTNYLRTINIYQHVLYYPQRPLISTRPSRYLNADKMPSGINAIVAIMCYTGYNQEDSLIFNKSSIDRGLFISSHYRKYEATEQKNQVTLEEERFCKPVKFNLDGSVKTQEIKPASYDKLDEETGLVKEGEYVTEKDIIIGKVIPLKSGEGTAQFKDSSVSIKANESGYVDRVYTNKDSDNYTFCKVKLRTEKIPEIGDKFACLLPNCEVLFENGWKFIKDITCEDRVAILDNDNVKYEYPEETHEYDYNGKMYDIKSQQIELTVTPNHRMWIKTRDSKSKYKKEFEFKTAENCFNKRLKYKKNINSFEPSEWIGDKFIIPAYTDKNNKYRDEIVVDIEDWVIFFGIWIAEGWSDRTQVSIAANKPRVQEALDKCLPKMGFNISKSKDHKWRICNVQLANLMVNYSVGAIHKYLPDWCWKLNKEQCKILLFSMELGDGYHSKSNNRFYYTSSKQLADDVTKLALHSGYSTHVRVPNGRKKGNQTTFKRPNGKMELVKTTTDNYVITIIKKKIEPEMNHGHCKTQNAQSENWIDYKGKVYCLTVRTGLFMVRQNGKPVWTGNSRHAQKGTIGMTYRSEDMPYTKDGMVPDIIMNPHALPSRMTIGQILECILGKVCLFKGCYGDATAFNGTKIKDIGEELEKYGFSKTGTEVLYNGKTGEQITTKIFIGPTYYQRLRHLVADKVHSRGTGPYNLMTRQPAEGRSREGGLRIGEMERDCLLSHGITSFLNERLFECSDKFMVYVCDICGHIAIANSEKNIYHCRYCENYKYFSRIRLPYSCKLFFQELQSMGIIIKIQTDKFIGNK